MNSPGKGDAKPGFTLIVLSFPKTAYDSLFILGQDGVAKYHDALETWLGKGGDWAVCMRDAVYAALKEIGAESPHPNWDTSTDLRTRFELEELAVIANKKGFNSALAIILKQIKLLKNQQNEEE